MSNKYQLYRCSQDGKLVFPDELDDHKGHKIGFASEGTILEFLKVSWKKYRGLLKKREAYQA